MPADPPRAVDCIEREMKLSVPRPLHGWREFAGEVGIIVIGVLIALGAQQVAEDWQWRERTGDARVRLARETGAMTAQLYERLIVQRCLLGRLSSLADQLESSGTDWKASPEQFMASDRFFANAMPVAYRPPRRDLVDSIWVNTQSDGTLAHLPRDEAERLAAVYANARNIQLLFDQEQQMAATLGPLSRDLILAPGDRTRMLQAIYGLDRLNSSVLFAARNLINDTAKLDLPFDRAAIRKSRKAFLDQQRSYRGTCVEAVPLDAGFNGPALGSERPALVR